jgi:predicted nicotinamide N-methyase
VVTAAVATIRAHTVLTPPSLVPEILLYQATELTAIWQATEAWLAVHNVSDPPFWAFAWPGGQALARYMLDHPARVAGRLVLDFAAGSGIAGLAAARAGAAWVEANDIDPLALAAVGLNAEANELAVAALAGDIVGSPCRWDLILCGDVCYEGPMTRRILPWLKAMAGGAEVWIADPGRAYLPADGLESFAAYDVPTSLQLEDRTTRRAVLYRLLPDAT